MLQTSSSTNVLVIHEECLQKEESIAIPECYSQYNNVLSLNSATTLESKEQNEKEIKIFLQKNLASNSKSDELFIYFTTHGSYEENKFSTGILEETNPFQIIGEGLKDYKGRIYIEFDSCHCGGLIENSEQENSDDKAKKIASFFQSQEKVFISLPVNGNSSMRLNKLHSTALSPQENFAVSTLGGMQDGYLIEVQEGKIIRFHNVDYFKDKQAVSEKPYLQCPFSFQNLKEVISAIRNDKISHEEKIKQIVF